MGDPRNYRNHTAAHCGIQLPVSMKQRSDGASSLLHALLTQPRWENTQEAAAHHQHLSTLRQEDAAGEEQRLGNARHATKGHSKPNSNARMPTEMLTTSLGAAAGWLCVEGFGFKGFQTFGICGELGLELRV